MPASIGVNLRVTGHCRQGGRKYMEDFFSVAYQQTEDEKDLEYAFFGIFDGHGGAEAAAFAKEHLMETIIKHKNFWSDNDEDVLRAIKDGYIATHYAMWREQLKWPKTSSGLPSTAGTTASVAFIRRGKIYVGHVGDSGIILGYQEPGNSEWRAKPLTKDHKPENSDEMKRIEGCGGKVVSKSGVPRVVWNRPKIGHQGPIRRSTPIDEIPFLAVARSLGDFWSYNSQINQFVVSPDPDCSVLPIDTNVHRCLIFGTDGLFNMLSSSMAVHIVQQAERHNECVALSDSVNKIWLNPSKLLVERALDRWHTVKMRADNTSVVTLMLDPPGPPRAQVLKDRKKNLPESGLRIMTRYDGTSPQEQSPQQTSCSRSVQTTEMQENTSKEDSAKPNFTADTPEAPQTKLDEHNEKVKEKDCSSKEHQDRKATKSSSESNNSNNIATSVSSSDISSNFPLKERNEKNFVPKLRESTSFDPREPVRTSLNTVDNGKENNSEVDDNTIQINEISSSNIEESIIDEDTTAESRESEKEKSIGRRNHSKKIYKSTENDDKKPSKRKLETDENARCQRKSLRLSLNQKFLLDIKKPAPCTLAEEKLKKLAEEAEKIKKLQENVESIESNNNIAPAKVESRKTLAAAKKLSITQKILRSKKINLKKKNLVKSQLNKKKLKIMLNTVLPKRGRPKLQKVVTQEKSDVETQKIVQKPKKIDVKFQKTDSQILKMRLLEKPQKSVLNLSKPINKSSKNKVETIVLPLNKRNSSKRQSFKNAPSHLKNNSAPKPIPMKPLRKVLKQENPKADSIKLNKNSCKPSKPPEYKCSTSGSSRASMRVSTKESTKVSIESKNKRDSLKETLKKETVKRSTRTSVGSSGKEMTAVKASRKIKMHNAKDTVQRLVTVKATTSNSSSKIAVMQKASTCKLTLRKRIENKTKTLRKTVLRKSN